jgi:hypothetical protein
MTMDGRKKELTATIEEEDLKVFIRSAPDELKPAELDLVAGGTGSCIEPNGINPNG